MLPRTTYGKSGNMDLYLKLTSSKKSLFKISDNPLVNSKNSNKIQKFNKN